MRDNIVTALFRNNDTCRTVPVWQYDYGLILHIEGLDLPAAYEVHFAGESGECVTQIGGADGVAIPDEYLLSGQSIHAWLYLHTGADDGETVKTIVIPVTKRAKPSDLEPTPVQQDAITEAIAALTDGVEAVQRAVANVQETVDTALAEARASGEFDGTKGDKGDPYSPPADRVTSLDGTGLESGLVVEAVGIPVYVSDPASYPDFGLTETGWYVFARIAAPEGVAVGAGTQVTGAAGAIIAEGAASVNVAVRFEVAAASKTVTVAWDAETEDVFVFKATDLAVRNLDYRTTFYVYDLAPFATWTYALTTDATFVADKAYFTLDGDTYTRAEVTAGAAVPANTYYNHAKLRIEGMTRNVTYQLDEIVDCPQEYVLPVIEDDGHGAWFEFRLRHSGSFSSTLIVPEGVKVATEHTQAETAGFNMVDLHYMSVDGVKIWRFMNTHSSVPT